MKEIPEAITFYENYPGGTAEAMIAFARRHVEAALKAASEKAEAIYTGDRMHPVVNKDSITNAYPLTNIK